MLQVHKGYHMQLRKFVAVKRVNTTNKVSTPLVSCSSFAVMPAMHHINLLVQPQTTCAAANDLSEDGNNLGEGACTQRLLCCPTYASLCCAVLWLLQEMRQQMLRDIKILSDAQDVPGLLSFLGAYLVQDRDQVKGACTCCGCCSIRFLLA